MKASELDKAELIKKVTSLPKDYWLKRFKRLMQDREKKLDDVEAELLYLFMLTQAEVLDLVESFIGRFNETTQNDRISRSELMVLKKYLSDISDEMDKEKISFDKDIERQIKNVNTRTTQLQALTLKVKAKLSYFYGVVNKRFNTHFSEITEDFYYRTIYEVVRAVGYDSDGITDLELLTLSELLSQTYRATGETFDDVVWRIGRVFNFDAETLLKRDLFKGEDIAIERLRKMFGSKFNEIQRNLETDMTFFSTLGQEKAFVSLEIEECIYTAIIDNVTSEFCLEADGNIIPVDEIEPWVNAPPLHYYCRSWLTPIVKAVNWLTGDVYEVEGDFKIWKKRHWENK